MIVKHKSGELRLFVDYRDFNTVRVKDHYPLPIIEDTYLVAWCKIILSSQSVQWLQADRNSRGQYLQNCIYGRIRPI